MAKPKLALIPAAQGTSLYSVLPSSGVGDFNFTRSGSATRINSQGLIETVADGVSRLNYPLIDGKVVGCPSHLLENSATNLITYSENFSNAYWTKGGSSVALGHLSPSGETDTYKITEDTSNNNHYLLSNPISSLSGYISISIFAKKGERNWIRLVNNNVIGAYFNLDNGTIGAKGSGVTAKIENYGNGWYRCSIIKNRSVAATERLIVYTSIDGTSTSYQGDGTSGIYIWGAQVEQGSFPTSYIPSLIGSQTTRSAETANGSGDASTFNDSEGVLMAEISAFGETVSVNNWITISDETSNNYIAIQQETTGYVIARVKSGGSTQALMSSLINQDIISKIAVKYKENDFSLYINGFELGSDNSGSVFSSDTLTKLHLNYINVSNDFYGNTKQLQYYDTALTDSELETLTSWVSFTDMAEGQLYTIE